MHEAEVACYYGYVSGCSIASNSAVIADALARAGVSASVAIVRTSAAATSRLTVGYTSTVAIATRTTIVFGIRPSSRLEPTSKH